MTTDVFNMVNEAGMTSYNSFQELNAININTLQKMTALQLGLVTLSVESTVEQAKLLADSSNYSNLVSIETEMLNQYGSKLLNITRNTGELLSQSRNDYMHWVEKCLNEKIVQTEKPASVKSPKVSKKRRTVKKAA